MDFLVEAENAIRDGFEDAWGTGALQCGIYSGEFTDAEMTALEIEINLEVSHLGGFADAIEASSKANDGALQPLLDRADLWAGAYNRIVSRANVMACADQKLRWVLGDTEHCSTCLGFADKVYRGSIWQKYLAPLDMLPQGRGLECGGWNCKCSFEVTTDRATPGKPSTSASKTLNTHSLIGHKHLHVH